jgi:hypothetical protein
MRPFQQPERNRDDKPEQSGSIHNIAIVILGAAACFVLRLAGLHYDWSMPRAKVRDA